MRGGDFPAKLELMLAAHPGNIVDGGVAVDRSLKALLLRRVPLSSITHLASAAQPFQPRDIHGWKIVCVECVQADLRIQRAVRARRIVEILAAGIREPQFVDYVRSGVVGIVAGYGVVVIVNGG